MTHRWRTVLRVRALLQALLERHVPMGTLGEVLERVSLYTDSELVERYARIAAPVGPAALAREAAWNILDEVVFDEREAYRRDVQRVIDEVERRRQDAQQAFAATADQGENAVVGAFDSLLAFLALEQAGVP
jgi:hypothetical protein